MKIKIIYLFGIILCFIILGYKAYSQKDCDHWVGKEFSLSSLPSSYDGITKGWVQISDFSDEFTSPSINTSKWNVKHNTCHSMSPKAYFKDDPYNAKLESGKLKLKAKYEGGIAFVCKPSTITEKGNDKGNYFYSSGYINSVEKIQYGYLEMKCYIPENIALAPCFWLVGAHWPDTMYIEYDEIDVFEARSQESSSGELTESIFQNIYHDVGLESWSYVNQIVDFNESWRGKETTFAVEWLPEEVYFYVNGVITSAARYTENNSFLDDTSPKTSHFVCQDIVDQLPQKIQISLSLSGLVSTYPDLSESFDVEYIRSYKLLEGYNYQYWPASFNINNSTMFKVHKSIKLGGDFHSAVIPENEDITIWAKEEIILDKGFTVSGNTNFAARVIATQPELFYSTSINHEKEK